MISQGFILIHYTQLADGLLIFLSFSHGFTFLGISPETRLQHCLIMHTTLLAYTERRVYLQPL